MADDKDKDDKPAKKRKSTRKSSSKVRKTTKLKRGGKLSETSCKEIKSYTTILKSGLWKKSEEELTDREKNEKHSIVEQIIRFSEMRGDPSVKESFKKSSLELSKTGVCSEKWCDTSSTSTGFNRTNDSVVVENPELNDSHLVEAVIDSSAVGRVNLGIENDGNPKKKKDCDQNVSSNNGNKCEDGASWLCIDVNSTESINKPNENEQHEPNSDSEQESPDGGGYRAPTYTNNEDVIEERELEGGLTDPIVMLSKKQQESTDSLSTHFLSNPDVQTEPDHSQRVRSSPRLRAKIQNLDLSDVGVPTCSVSRKISQAYKTPKITLSPNSKKRTRTWKESIVAGESYKGAAAEDGFGYRGNPEVTGDRLEEMSNSSTPKILPEKLERDASDDSKKHLTSSHSKSVEENDLLPFKVPKKIAYEFYKKHYYKSSSSSKSPTVRNESPGIADHHSDQSSDFADSSMNDWADDEITATDKKLAEFNMKKHQPLSSGSFDEELEKRCFTENEDMCMSKHVAEVLRQNTQKKKRVTRRKSKKSLNGDGQKRVQETISVTPAEIVKKRIFKDDPISGCTTPSGVPRNSGVEVESVNVSISSTLELNTKESRKTQKLPQMNDKHDRKLRDQTKHPGSNLDNRGKRSQATDNITSPLIADGTASADSEVLVSRTRFESPRPEVDEMHSTKKSRSSKPPEQSPCKAVECSVLESAGSTPNRPLVRTVLKQGVRSIALSDWFPKDHANMRVNGTTTKKNPTELVNGLGLSPRHPCFQKSDTPTRNVSSSKKASEVEKTDSNDGSPCTPLLDYDYFPVVWESHEESSESETTRSRFCKKSKDTSTKRSPSSSSAGQPLVCNAQSASYTSEDSSSDYESNLNVSQSRKVSLNYQHASNNNDDCHSQSSEISIYGGFYKQPMNLNRGFAEPKCSDRTTQSRSNDQLAQLECNKMVATPSLNLQSLFQLRSEADEWIKYVVNWDNPTYFEDENSCGVYYDDPSSHHKAQIWTNKLHNALKALPVSILKKKSLVEGHIKNMVRQVTIFDAIGTSSALALTQSTLNIIKGSICPQYWNGESCNKTCKKKHKMNCDEFPSVSTDEVFRAVSTRLMEIELPPLEMVTSFIEWLCEHKQTVKVLSFSKILLSNKGFNVCTTLCTLFIKNLSKCFEWHPASVVEYLLKFQYFMMKKDPTHIVASVNKLIAYCQVGTYKHKVYDIVRFLLDIEGYLLPFKILDKVLYEVSNNPPADIMMTKDKIKNQLKSFEKCADPDFRARAFMFLQTYFPETNTVSKNID